MQQQLPLKLALRDDCTLETFYPGDNQQALTQIKQMAQGRGELFVYLWGREGVGCTHLLQGACYSAQRRGAVYISFAEARSPRVLEGLERLELVCLDELEKIAGLPLWEEAFFHLYNRLRAANRRLLVAATCAPKALPIQLADLQSRLTWGITYQLQPLNDEQLLAALQLRAKERGLVLTQEVGAFLIRRCTRSMPDLYLLLEKLDKASLVAQRRLTIPFVKSVLMM